MRIRSRYAVTALAGLVVLGGALLASCGDDEDDGEEGGRSDNGAKVVKTDQVSVEDFGFKPEVIQVRPGTEVTWTNEDSAAHRIVEEGGAFEGEDIGQGDQTVRTYDAAGVYPYFCGIHNSMHGTVIVK
jgi:plastocyanin